MEGTDGSFLVLLPDDPPTATPPPAGPTPPSVDPDDVDEDTTTTTHNGDTYYWIFNDPPREWVPATGVWLSASYLDDGFWVRDRVAVDGRRETVEVAAPSEAPPPVMDALDEHGARESTTFNGHTHYWVLNDPPRQWVPATGIFLSDPYEFDGNLVIDRVAADGRRETVPFEP